MTLTAETMITARRIISMRCNLVSTFSYLEVNMKSKRAVRKWLPCASLGEYRYPAAQPSHRDHGVSGAPSSSDLGKEDDSTIYGAKTAPEIR